MNRGLLFVTLLGSGCADRIGAGDSAEQETDTSGLGESTLGSEDSQTSEDSETSEPIDPALCILDDASGWVELSGTSPYSDDESPCIVSSLTEDGAGWSIGLECSDLPTVDGVRFEANPKPDGPPVIVGEALELTFVFDSWPHGAYSELTLRDAADGSLRLLSAGGMDGSYDSLDSLLAGLKVHPLGIDLFDPGCPIEELQEECWRSFQAVKLFSTVEEYIVLLPGSSSGEIGDEPRFAVWGTRYDEICGGRYPIGGPRGRVTIAAILDG